MAIQEILYICEVCGTKFNKQEKAEKCESQHFEVVKIDGIFYDKKENKKELPLSINMRLKDKNGKEKIVTYYRK